MDHNSHPLRHLVLAFIIVAVIIAGGLWALRQTSPQTATNPKPTTQTTDPSDTATVADHAVKIAYIAVDDKGVSGELIGCDDSIILVNKTVQATAATQGALQALLSDKNQHFGESGLYNALSQSTLTIDSVTTANDIVTVKLSGDLQIAGECDSPRIKAQLESTAKASSDVSTAVISLNGKSIDEALSLK